MSEIKHKEWQTIKNLRDEIRQDMEDYKLACSYKHKSTFNSSLEEEALPVKIPLFSKDIDSFFRSYLRLSITNNLHKLKELLKKEQEKQNISYWRFLKDEYQKWMTGQYYLILTDNKKIDFIAKGILHGFVVCILLGVLIPFCFVISKIGGFIVSLLV